MNRVRRLVSAEEIYKRGIRGRGITVAIMDSGICHHPDYSDRVICFKDFVGKKSDLYDDASHGSHVTGIVAGNGMMSDGKYRGIAPECDLVHLKVLDQNGTGKINNAIAAMDWVIRNRNKFNIRILNFSVGIIMDEEEEDGKLLVEWVEKVWDAGIVVVVAAGNMGPKQGSITVPGTSRKVITVGFYDDSVKEMGRSSRYYSGRGPTGTCICKPEITAPGAAIISCSNMKPSGHYYCRKSGSSMATPVVSGGIALLLSEKPWMTNLEVKMKLKDAVDDMGFPKDKQGWGRLNLIKLLE